jgi:tetratricopeptide (TPR) repeat protein
VVVARRRRWPGPAAAWAAYVAILLPVAGIAHNGPQIAADRYAYLACMPVALLPGAGAILAWRRLRARPAGPTLAGVGVALAAGVVALLGALTWMQTLVWHDSESLWLHALATSPSAIAHNNLAVLRTDQDRWDEVLAHSGEALRLRPTFAEPHAALGAALDRRGQSEEAIAHFREALRLKPRLPAAWNHWGVALGRQGRLQEAIELFQRAIELNPDYADAHHNIGVVLERAGRRAEAMEYYAMAQRLRQVMGGR